MLSVGGKTILAFLDLDFDWKTQVCQEAKTQLAIKQLYLFLNLHCLQFVALEFNSFAVLEIAFWLHGSKDTSNSGLG